MPILVEQHEMLPSKFKVLLDAARDGDFRKQFQEYVIQAQPIRSGDGSKVALGGSWKALRGSEDYC